MAPRARRPTDEPTAIREPAGRAIEHATPTQLDPPPDEAFTGLGSSDAHPPVRAPLHVISMKQQVDAERGRAEIRRVPLHVQLRSLAEVARRNDTPTALRQLGRLAPPRDPRQVRARHWRANLLWACVAIALACGISLVVWFAAGR